jgi:hypothetical protein
LQFKDQWTCFFFLANVSTALIRPIDWVEFVCSGSLMIRRERLKAHRILLDKPVRIYREGLAQMAMVAMEAAASSDSDNR